jgi:hypothetical protein
MSAARKLRRSIENKMNKQMRKELCKELGVSVSHFKRKMPRMKKGDSSATPCEDRTGSRPSLSQQTDYLLKLSYEKLDQTSVIREEIARIKKEQEENG